MFFPWILYYTKISLENEERFFMLNKDFFTKAHITDILFLLLGSAIQAFGLYNIHSISGVTEGGILGLILLLKHWFHISPAISGFCLNFSCYLLGWKILGGKFIVYSVISGGAFSVFYGIFEQFPPAWPEIGQRPLLAAIAGALFIGIGVGLCVRAGGAPGGDDALAMSLSKITGKDIQWVYLISDLVVLLLSLSYIPVQRIGYSLITVILSGQLVGWVSTFTFCKLLKQKI